jgi:glycosyltransferase involved in cell wall biosynthesis
MKKIAMLLIGNIDTDGRVQKEIASLKSRGHSVTLIQWAYTGAKSDKKQLGVDILDYPYLLVRSATRNFLRQIRFNFFALRHLKRLRPDIVQCNDLNTLIAGYLFRHRAQIIYDAHELFSESQKGLRKIIWGLLERIMVPACHAYIQPEQNRRTYFARKYDLPESSVALVENFPSGKYPVSGRNRLRESLPIAEDKKIVLYTGMLAAGRKIEDMIQSMSLLDSRFVLVLIGPTFKGYDKKLVDLVANLRLQDRVIFHPEIPNAEMLDYINSGDIGLVFYENTSLNNYWCASNKLYEFIFCGKPVITNDYPGLKEVVEKNQLGACLSDSTPELIANAIKEAEEMEPAAHEPYVWERQEEEYLGLFA